MSDQPTNGFTFRIREVTPTAKPAASAPADPPPTAPTAAPAGQAATKQPPKAQAAPAPEPAHEPAPESAPARVAGLFPHARAALAFLGAVAGAGLAHEASARRGPAGHCWVEVAAPWQHAAGLVANAGGQAFAGGPHHWVAAPADGSAPPPPAKPPADAAASTAKGDWLLQRRDGFEVLEMSRWAALGLADLVQAGGLRRAKARLHGHAVVVAAGVLARTALRRALGAGLAVQWQAAEQRPLAGGEVQGVACVHLDWGDGRAPESLLAALARLPGVAVVRPAGSNEAGREAIWVDIRYAPPFAGALLAELVPAGEVWLLGGPEVGHWRVVPQGKPVDGGDFIAPPAQTLPPLPAAAAPTLPPPVPLRLAPCTPSGTWPDAVLLDDTELGWLRTFLIGKPAADTAYLVPGPGRHLLLAPGGLLGVMPFGLGLRRIGPAGVYLQEGRALHPPLPEAARAHAFPCGTDEMLTLCNDGDAVRQTRFATADLVPVWALWLPIVPAPNTAALPATLQGLRALAARLEPPRIQKSAQKVLPKLQGKRPTDRDQLLREAIRLEQQGMPAEAAQCMEQAGEAAAAARLYEKAAAREV